MDGPLVAEGSGHPSDHSPRVTPVPRALATRKAGRASAHHAVTATVDGVAGQPEHLDGLCQHISNRVRKRRIELGLTCRTLASAVGVSNQQMQKYETGQNRLSAGMLYVLSHSLNVAVGYFYEDLAGLGGSVELRAAGMRQRPPRALLEFLRSVERINDAALLAALGSLTRVLAETAGTGGSNQETGSPVG